MFNVGFAELIVVMLIAFLIVGPKDLPKVARWIARQVKAIQKMIHDIKDDLGWEEMKEEFKDTKSDLEHTFKGADISSELKDAGYTVQKSFGGIKNDIERRE